MAPVDISLDDMIKDRKSNGRGGQGQSRPQRGRGLGGSSRGGGRPFLAPRRNPLAVNARPSSFAIAKSIRKTKNLAWQNGLFEDSLKAASLSGLEAGTKLYISNLDAGVSNEDIRELFLEIGELIRYAIHFDKNGRPSGSAEVVFLRKNDAFQAFRRYNNVQLDGKPMKIEIVGSNMGTPISDRVNAGGGVNEKKRTVVITPGSSRGGLTVSNRGFLQMGRGGSSNGRAGAGRRRGGARGRGGGARGGARWVKKRAEKSADELDKELESYHAEAMQS